MDAVLRANGWSDLGGGMGSLAADPRRPQRDVGGRRGHAPRAVAEHGQPRLRPGRLDDQARRTSSGSASAFGAGLGLVDYVADPDAARDTINAWVARQTHDRIKKLLGPTGRHRGHPARARQRDLHEGQLGERVRSGADGQPRRSRRPIGTSTKVPTMRMAGGQDIALAQGNGLEGHGAAVRRGERFARSR